MGHQKMGYFLFFILSALCISAILFMIFSRNQAYNALSLVLAFACTGGLFALMGAPFIATVQIIIYAGAIMILFVFAIMMINVRQGMPPEKKTWTRWLALIAAAALVIELLAAGYSISSAAKLKDAVSADPTSLGALLFSKYLYPFEITSLLIIAALVGAIVLAKKQEGE